MTSYHLSNASIVEYSDSFPSRLKKGGTFELRSEGRGSEGGGWRGAKVFVPAGTYRVVSKKHFVGGTIEVAPL